jgi:eukaryotic-like serine/threonine-protein kinase
MTKRRPSKPPPLRRPFGSFELLSKLGEGGMAEVFLAERRMQAGFRQKVALKTVHPRYRNDPSVRERFVTEARTNARLSHSNIPVVVDFGTDPAPYLALEYIDGATLNELMYRMYELRQHLDVSTAMFIGACVAQALNHAHGLKADDGTPLGIVHRDIAPKNVLLRADGTPYLVDFGLAQVADNVLETYGAMPVGTFCYMAPEQLAGGHVDARADLFAFGILLWEMLTTRQLIPTNDPRQVIAIHQKGLYPKPSEFNADVTADLDSLTLQCLRFDPSERPVSAEAISVPLQRMLHERSPGYGSEQLAKTLHWAFPDRAWSRKAPNEAGEQPQLHERARLAHFARNDSSANPVVEWAKENTTALVVFGILLAICTVCAFSAGALLGAS